MTLGKISKKFGPSIATFGLQQMTRKQRQSLAGGMLRNGDTPAAGALGGATKMLSFMKKGNVFLASISTIAKGIWKTLNTLAKHSPALQQQMIILRKSFSLFLRPIGDLLSRYVRPMAIMSLKTSKAWYKKLIGSVSGGNSSTAEKVDYLEQLNSQLESAQSVGDVSRTEDIQNEINKVSSEIAASSDILSSERKTLKVVTGGFSDVVLDGAKKYANVFTEFVDSVTSGKTDFETAWNNLMFEIKRKSSSSKKYGPRRSNSDDIYASSKQKKADELELKTKTTAYKPSPVLSPILSSLISSHATGGEIQTTGLYNLHAGERVINAGDNSRTTKGDTNISNTFNVQATINSDIDIRMLAAKLADYSETELRRRSSYL